MSKCPRLSALLPLLVAATLSAQEGGSLFTEDFPPDEFAARREKVMDEIGSSAIAVVHGAPTPVGYVRFRQSNEFYYLTGIEVPHAYVLIDGSTRTSTLYLPHPTPMYRRIRINETNTSDAWVTFSRAR